MYVSSNLILSKVWLYAGKDQMHKNFKEVVDAIWCVLEVFTTKKMPCFCPFERVLASESVTSVMTFLILNEHTCRRTYKRYPFMVKTNRPLIFQKQRRFKWRSSLNQRDKKHEQNNITSLTNRLVLSCLLREKTTIVKQSHHTSPFSLVVVNQDKQ